MKRHFRRANLINKLSGVRMDTHKVKTMKQDYTKKALLAQFEEWNESQSGESGADDAMIDALTKALMTALDKIGNLEKTIESMREDMKAMMQPNG